jgi:subtilisin family serine protease
MKKTLALLGLALACFLLALAGVGGSIYAAPAARPTPTPGIPSPQDLLHDPEGPLDDLPDLIASDIWVDQPDALGITTTIRVMLRNQGSADVAYGNNFYLDLYIDPAIPPESGRPGQPGTLFEGVQGIELKRGEDVMILFEFAFPRARAYTLYAMVDSQGDVVEADEDNNVFGPIVFQSRPTSAVIDVNHEDFQAGFSNMDLSHPVGLVALSGLYEEPITAPPGKPMNTPLQGPTLYNPDFGVSNFVASVNQVAPVIARNAAGDLYVVWEDGRNGETANRDIFFARSTDEGTTWSADARVNRDPYGVSVNQQSPAMVYDPVRDTIYVAWQDERGGDYDIWFARSTDGGTLWTEPVSNPISDDASGAAQVSPSLAVDESGTLYAVWQDRRNGNDDIYFAASADGGDTWSENILVTDHPAATVQSQRSPAISVAGGRIYVVWEDARNVGAGDAGDIYFTWGLTCSPPCTDYGFDVDRRLNGDSTLRVQRDPAIIQSTPRIEITRTEVFTPGSQVCASPPPMTTEVQFRAVYQGQAIHFAWQDYRNGTTNPDIYYAWTFAPYFYLETVVATPDYGCPPTEPFFPVVASPFGPDYPLFGDEAVNDIPPTTPASCLEPPYQMGDDDLPCEPPLDPSLHSDRAKRLWNTSGSIQEHPAFSPGPPNSDTVYILWADRRNYDAWNSDIYIARPQRQWGNSEYVVGDNIIVNDNAKLLRYLTDDRYVNGAPASVRQFRPAGVYADGADIPYVVWDDNRRADPLAGYALDRNIFFARPGEPPAPGVFMSRIFEANNETRWNLLEWWGVTPVCTEIFFQTRTGATPWPDGAWSEWTGPAWNSGMGMWGYDAPAEIVDATGGLYPEARYFQYRFWIIDCDGGWKGPWTDQDPSPAWVSKVVVHYSPKEYTALLPLIVKDMRGPEPTPTPTHTSPPTQTPAPTPQSRIPNDTYYANYQWNLRHINLPQAWDISVGSPNVQVAILDTGIDASHPDLSGKVVGGYDFINGDTDAGDDEGHGTHVAGIVAAATNNSRGIAGVAWNAQLLSVKVLDEHGIGPMSSIASGIIWAADHGAEIINLSLGSESTNQALLSAVTNAHNKGALLVAAAGNSFLQGNPIIYPAAHVHVVAVGSTGDADEHAAYSQTGSYLDLTAPGGNPLDSSDTNRRHWIYSTYWRGSPYGGAPAVGYMPVAGTSQACPHVAGVAALLKSVDPSLTHDEMEGILRATAIDLGTPGRDNIFGYGRVDALAALQEVASSHAAVRPDDALDAPPATFDGAEFVAGRVLVRFKDGETTMAVQDTLGGIGAKVVGEIPQIDWLIVQVDAGGELDALDILRADPRVEYAELDYLMYAL